MSVAKINNVGRREFHISGAYFAIPRKMEDMEQFCKYIKEHNIDSIVNVSDYSIPPIVLDFYKQCGIKNVVYSPFQDRILSPREYAPIIKLLENIYRQSRRFGNTLVHCSAGINRSATVIAYIVNKSTGLDMGYVIQKIRLSNASQRNIHTLSNYTFSNLLRNFV